MFKKIASFMLAVLCCAPLFLGCGSADTTDTNTNDTTEVQETTETTVPETTRIAADLPEMNFEGKELRIYTMSHEDTEVQNDFWTQGENGEPLNDAVYARNTAIEERYNAKIKCIEEKRTEMLNKTKTAILAGDDNWHVINDCIRSSNDLTQSGYLIELTGLDYFDFDAQWWDQRFISDMSIGGKLYHVIGEFNTMTDSQTWGFIFNKKLVDDLNLGDFYELVRNGTWTLDAAIEKMNATKADLNGDGVMDVNDRWGIFTEVQNLARHLSSAGERVSSKDKNDMPMLTLNNERAMSVIEKAYNLLRDKTVSFVAGDWSKLAVSNVYTEFIIPMFMADQGLFYHTGIGNTFKHMRDMKSPYGVVPNPKFDEAQDEYYHVVAEAWATTVAIPITCKDPDFAAFMLEALAAESVNEIRDVYHNILFENKGLRDEDSIEMVDLIISTRIYDIGLFNNWGKITDNFNAAAKATSFDFASRYASIEAAMISGMNNTISLYEKLMK